MPGLEKALIDTINRHIDAHHVSGGAIGTALACVIGEMIMMANDTEHAKRWFLQILDAYITTGADGARVGPDTEPSLVRRVRPWPTNK